MNLTSQTQRKRWAEAHLSQTNIKEAHMWETERGGFFLFIVLCSPGGRGKRGVCLMGFYRQVEVSVSTSCPVPSFFPHSRFRQMPLPRRASVEKRRNSAIPFRINANKKSPSLLNTKNVKFRTLVPSLPLFPTWQLREQKVQNTCA